MKRAQSNAHEIESPSGIDLHPEPPSAVRLSKRAGIVGLVVAFGVVASLGYGIITRGGRSLPMGFEIDGSRNLTASTDAGKVMLLRFRTALPSLGARRIGRRHNRISFSRPTKCLDDQAGALAYGARLRRRRIRRRQISTNIESRHRKRS